MNGEQARYPLEHVPKSESSRNSQHMLHRIILSLKASSKTIFARTFPSQKLMSEESLLIKLSDKLMHESQKIPQMSIKVCSSIGKIFRRATKTFPIKVARVSSFSSGSWRSVVYQLCNVVVRLSLTIQLNYRITKNSLDFWRRRSALINIDTSICTRPWNDVVIEKGQKKFRPPDSEMWNIDLTDKINAYDRLAWFELINDNKWSLFPTRTVIGANISVRNVSMGEIRPQTNDPFPGHIQHLLGRCN